MSEGSACSLKLNSMWMRNSQFLQGKCRSSNRSVKTKIFKGNKNKQQQASKKNKIKMLSFFFENQKCWNEKYYATTSFHDISVVNLPFR